MHNALRTLRDFLRLFVQRFIAANCPQVAGSLTFTTLLALVPLLTVTIALFSSFPVFSEIGDALKAFLLTHLLPERAGQIVTTYALEFSQKAAGLTVVGTVMLAVTSLMLLSTIERVLNQIWRVREPRSLFFRVAVYWFALSLGPVLFGGSVFASGYLISVSLEMVGQIPWITVAAARLLPPLLLGALFSYLYFAVPNHPVRLAHALAGGMGAAVAFVLMQRAFGLFIAYFPTYTLIYGAFAALPIFLVWLYLSWLIVLGGALASAVLSSFAEQRRTLARFPGDTACAAIDLLIRLARQHRDGGSLDGETLLAATCLPAEVCEQVLGELRAAGWVMVSEENGWVLARAPAAIPVHAVIRRFAFDPAGWTPPPAAVSGHDLPARLDQLLDRADWSVADLLDPPGRPAPDTGNQPG